VRTDPVRELPEEEHLARRGAAVGLEAVRVETGRHGPAGLVAAVPDPLMQTRFERRVLEEAPDETAGRVVDGDRTEAARGKEKEIVVTPWNGFGRFGFSAKSCVASRVPAGTAPPLSTLTP
jgi:hypothetical protein